MAKRRNARPDPPPPPPAPAAPFSGSPASPLLAAGFAAILTIVAAYSNHFHNSFHFDDSHVIQNNIYIRSLNNIPLFFKSGATFSSIPSNATYRPLTSVLLAVDYAIGHGLNPVAFHVTQWTLHLLTAIAIFCFYRRLLELAGRPAPLLALFGATLFGVHRANSEAVNYLSSCSDVASTLAVVLSFLLYQRFPKWRFTFVWLVPAAAGALSKPSALMFAPLFVAYIFLFPSEREVSGRSGRRMSMAALALPPFVVAAALYLLQSKLRGPGLTYSVVSPKDYFQTQIFAWTHYVRLFFVPLGLSADTDWPVIGYWYDTRVFAGLIVAALLVGAALVYARRSILGRGFLFGVVWFYFALAPTSSFLPLSEMINEHRVYFPYIGLIGAVLFALADLFGQLPQARRPAMLAGFILIAAQAGGTYQRNTVWMNEETLWKNVTETSPGNARGWMNYGLIFMARGDWAQTRTCFERALVNAPNYDFLEVNFGILEGASGHPADAERHFRRAVDLNLNPAMSNFYYARWLHQAGREAEAAEHVQRSLAASPADLEARHLLMHVYKAMHDDARYCAAARETLALLPSDALALAAAAECK